MCGLLVVLLFAELLEVCVELGLAILDLDNLRLQTFHDLLAALGEIFVRLALLLALLLHLLPDNAQRALGFEWGQIRCLVETLCKADLVVGTGLEVLLERLEIVSSIRHSVIDSLF